MAQEEARGLDTRSRWPRRMLRAGPRAVRDLMRPSDLLVETAVRLAILVAIALANLGGAAVVVVLSLWVLTPHEVDVASGDPLLVNLAVGGGYLVVALAVVIGWALHRSLPARRWIAERRPPTSDEQRILLRAPVQVMTAMATLWLGGALLFAGLNTGYFEIELASRLVWTIALAGLVSCAVGYLLTERLLRPLAARALSARPLEQPALPGVTVRSLFAWALGSGIPLVGLVLIALSALVEEDFSRTELAIAVLSIGGLAIVVGLLATLLAAKVAATPIAELRAALDEVAGGNLEVDVKVYDGTEVGLLQSGFNRMVAGLRDRERIRDLFGRQVGEDAARATLAGEVELGGETRRVASLFVDVIGSTAIAAERHPTEVVALLNRFFAVVIEVVDQHGGWVNKFQGDAVLAIFGAPTELPDPAGRALAAGRTLGARLASEVEGLEAAIGIGYGEVVAGHVGAEDRYEYTVIGDPVNEAARLCELAKKRPDRVLATAAALAAAPREEAGRWSIEGQTTLRGRKGATTLAAPGGSSRAARDRSPAAG